MDLWILVYSPATNLNIIKLLYFRHSFELEYFVTTNNDSVHVHHFEQIHFELKIDANHFGNCFSFDDKSDSVECIDNTPACMK